MEKCKSSAFRRKLLEKGNKLTLTLTLSEAANFEAVEHRTREMSLTEDSSSQSEINSIQTSVPWRPQAQYNKSQSTRHPRYNNSSSQSQSNSGGASQCMRCGRDKSHEQCPAFGKQCHRCKRQNHFKHMCRGSVNHVHVDPNDSAAPAQSTNPDEDHYAFSLQTLCVNATNQPQKAVVTVGGVEINAIIDSGADCNIIDQALWNDMKDQCIKVNRFVKGGPSVYPYSSKDPLPIVGQFWADINGSSGKVVSNAKFLVVESKADPILGIDTSVELELIKFANSTVTNQTLKEKFPNTFSGKIGKAEGEIRLTVDESVPPVTQPFRRVPFA